MDKPARHKGKNKKQQKPKPAKKKKTEGPTCSTFLSEIARKLAIKKRQEQEPRNVVQTIIDSITNALPVKFSRRSPQKRESPVLMETLQSLAPELLPNNTVTITQVDPDVEMPNPVQDIEMLPEPQEQMKLGNFKIPRMPLVSSDVFKVTIERRRPVAMEDASVNTSSDHDVASEIAKHVTTLKKISLIAEEFNQKTAKNLKEIVDSVQEDLIKKLEEIRTEQSTSSDVKASIQEQAA